MLDCKVFVEVNHSVYLNEVDFKVEKFCRVWQKVIYQAFIDSGNTSQKSRAKVQKLRAINWLKGEEDSFYEVCLLAGLEPNYVKKQVIKTLRRVPEWIGNSQELYKILSGDMD